MSAYDTGTTVYRDKASQIVRSGWVTARGGALSIAYIIHHIILLFLLPAAVFIFFFGTGGTLIDPAKAYDSWDWWRIYGFAFVLFVAPFGEYWLYQERKVAFSSNSASAVSFYNRSQINIIWGIWMTMIVLLGVWATILTIWVGVADFGDCAASALCGGPSGGTTPSTGAIMIIVGMGVTSLLFIVLFLGGLYVHSAARDAYASRIAQYFPIASQIGAETGSSTADAVDPELQQWVHSVLSERPDPLVAGIESALQWVADYMPAMGPQIHIAREENGAAPMHAASMWGGVEL